jgi:phage tail-like protein
MSGSPLRIDPYLAFNFLISLIDSSSTVAVVASAIGSVAVGGFSECSGLEMSLDVEEYREGGNNGTVLKFPTRIKPANLKLKTGVALRDDLWAWLYGFSEGQVQRRDGVVTLLDQQKNPVKVWSFRRGLPVRWSGPTLNASQNQVAIQELEIAHEGLRLL